MKKLLFLSILLLSTFLVQAMFENNLPSPTQQYFISPQDTAFLLKKTVNPNNEPCLHSFFSNTEGYIVSIACGVILTHEEYEKYITALAKIKHLPMPDNTQNIKIDNQQQES
ncbi:hypothetical protein EKK58_03345 [Candidatus Dependentiae bacterium]|nr:MAG: hypothetical protein EKK58_03345 [Candidatus Dependentiae bacterium]